MGMMDTNMANALKALTDLAKQATILLNLKAQIAEVEHKALVRDEDRRAALTAHIPDGGGATKC